MQELTKEELDRNVEEISNTLSEIIGTKIDGCKIENINIEKSECSRRMRVSFDIGTNHWYSIIYNTESYEKNDFTKEKIERDFYNLMSE